MNFVVLESCIRDTLRTPAKCHGPFESGQEAANWASKQDWNGKEWLAMPVTEVVRAV